MIAAATESTFINKLKTVREHYYAHGQMADPNGKLEEIAKTLAIFKLTFGKDEKTPLEKWLELDHHEQDLFSQKQYGTAREKLADALLRIQSDPAKKSTFDDLFPNGAELKLIEESDDFINSFLRLVYDAFKTHQGHNQKRRDSINEAFTMFIRDSFREHTEDAQYLTPSEVVDFMAKAALSLHTTNNTKEKKESPLIICDPACGVGSFLVHAASIVNETQQSQRLKLVGFDKAQRMVLLSKINLLLADRYQDAILQGNSLFNPQFQKQYSEKVDIILANPPFGARYDSTEVLRANADAFPLLKGILSSRPQYWDSELLFIDFATSILKENGIMAIIVPNSVVSSKGNCEYFRRQAEEHLELLAVIELPVTTFAQAGTRTRANILFFRKSKKKTVPKAFFGLAQNLGFEVRRRKGMGIRVPVGVNDLPALLERLQEPRSASLSRVNFSWNHVTEINARTWDPKQYIATARHKENSKRNQKDYDLIPLSELACIVKKERVPDDECYPSISVLHVSNTYLIDIASTTTYQPKYRGQRCNPGDILLSKLNPHILRVTVVPHIAEKLSCSTEFAIIQPISSRIDTRLLFSLLTLKMVQTQLISMASGTSSSHNRVKDEDLLRVQIPLPTKNTERAKLISVAAKRLAIVDALLDEYSMSQKSSFLTLLSI